MSQSATQIKSEFHARLRYRKLRDRAIEFVGVLDAGQRSRLLEIANQCPVHRTLSSRIDIKTTAV